jgi:hypothetical protein
MNPTSAAGMRTNESATYEEVWLLGQPPLGDFLDFVKSSVVNGSKESPAMLTDAWRAANDYYQELEDSEHGIADRLLAAISIRPSPPWRPKSRPIPGTARPSTACPPRSVWSSSRN